MTTDAKVIRAGRYAEIGKIIQRDSTALVDRWSKRAVEEQASARRVHHEALLDELPAFLWELGAELSEVGSSNGAPHRRLARRHAEQRWQTGWSLAELIRDYQLLRIVLLDYLNESLDRPLQIRESLAVGLALDEAIEVSVEHYVLHRDEHLRQLEESLRRQGDALQEADRRKNEFLATLAHELRNPLAPLRNALEVIRLAGDSPATFGRVREMMDRQVQQMTRLLEDVLDVSRIAQGKLVLRKSPVDLRQVLEQAVQMNAPLVEARRHRLEVELPAAPLWVDGDHARLIQVFVNLLNNAAKYTPEGGRIGLAALREGGGAAVVRVRDNGVGIPADMLPHIFELFTQLEVASEEASGGLGIGLTLVRRLVEFHGGTIAASSPGTGLGSEFVVRLPPCEPAAPPPEEPVPQQGASGRHILIIEDNRDGRESLALLLQLLGHRVDVAEDGPQGVQAGLRLRPEIALVDIGLPGLDGYEVAAQLRAGLGSGVLLLALTGHGQPEDRQRSCAAGFNAHLVKPVELEALRAFLGHQPQAAETA